MLMMGRESGRLPAHRHQRPARRARPAGLPQRTGQPIRTSSSTSSTTSIRGSGEIEVIPQDIGRAFLNIIANACYATDEKRRGLVEAGEGGSYMPTVWLTTKAERGQRRGPNQGQRQRHTAGGRRPDLQPLLHNQAHRPGHGPRPRPHQRHRPRARRHYPGRLPTRSVHRDDTYAATEAARGIVRAGGRTGRG